MALGRAVRLHRQGGAQDRRGLPGRQPRTALPIITKARTQLGYNPTVLVDEGLRRSLVWYGGNREAEEA